MLQRERRFSRSPTVYTPSTLSRGRGVQTCFGVTIFLTGIVDDKNTLKAMLETVSRNLHVEKNGKRYRPSFKLFLEVLLMLGGPRIATFVATNLGGPEIHSIYRWLDQHRVDISGGIQETNFKKLGPLYKDAMANIKSSSVPVLAAEDETAIIDRVTYHQDTDELFGF